MPGPEPESGQVSDLPPRREYVKPQLKVVPMENALAKRGDLTPFYVVAS
jgi:hypothetical protein